MNDPDLDAYFAQTGATIAETVVVAAPSEAAMVAACELQLRTPSSMTKEQFVDRLELLCFKLEEPDYSTRMNLLALQATRGKVGWGRSSRSSIPRLRPAKDIRPIRADEYPDRQRPDFPRLRLGYDPDGLTKLFLTEVQRMIAEAKASGTPWVANGMTHTRTFINEPAENLTPAEHIALYNRPWAKYDEAVKAANYRTEQRKRAEREAGIR